MGGPEGVRGCPVWSLRHHIRHALLNGAHCFVLAGVCGVLEIANSRNVTARLDEDEKGDVHIMDAIGRQQMTTVITESGLYSLIPLHPATIGGHEVQSVSARELHAGLSVGRDFSNWIKDRIRQYGFLEGTDYVWTSDLSTPELATSSGHGGARPQRVVEYWLTLNMAKELAMVERNAQGRAIRRYFIECERIAKTVTQPVVQAPPADPLALLRAHPARHLMV